jgi:hypothetical protein
MCASTQTNLLVVVIKMAHSQFSTNHCGQAFCIPNQPIFFQGWLVTKVATPLMHGVAQLSKIMCEVELRWQFFPTKSGYDDEL